MQHFYYVLIHTPHIFVEDWWYLKPCSPDQWADPIISSSVMDVCILRSSSWVKQSWTAHYLPRLILINVTRRRKSISPLSVRYLSYFAQFCNKLVTGDGSGASSASNGCQILYFCERLKMYVVHVKIGNFVFPRSCIGYIVRPAPLARLSGAEGGDYSREQKGND